MRPSKRKVDQMRSVTLEPNFMDQADGSCLIRVGGTAVICTATVEDRVPAFLRNSGRGWVTAEYSMLPCATATRVDRESARGKQTGRTHEIQRLIGRCLRSVVDFDLLGERQVRLDCDVLRADGGTRTASITGAYVALYYAMKQLYERKRVRAIPLTDQVCAVSCGIYDNTPVLDLDYQEDANAQADANFVFTSRGRLVEIQASAESYPFEERQFTEMMALAKNGCRELTKHQLKATAILTR